ncbi:MAG: DUF349 domain-containing protein [Bacteroidota bacterium]
MENNNLLNTVPEEENTSMKDQNADTIQPIINTEEPTNSNEFEVAEELESAKEELLKEQIIAEPSVDLEIIDELDQKEIEIPAIEPVISLETSDNETSEIIPEVIVNEVVEIEELPQPITNPIAEISHETQAEELISQIEAEEIDEIDEEDDSQLQFNKEDIEIMSLEQLVELLEKTVVHKVEKIKSKVSVIRNCFTVKIREEKNIIKEAFLANGGVLEEYIDEPTAVENRFNEAFKIYKAQKARLNEQIEKQKNENVALKTELLASLKELIESDEPLKKTYDSFKEIQETWKKIGPVPQSEVNNLWQNYHFYVERFFDKVKINKELRDLDLKKNLEQKIQLCEKVEELLLETSINKTFKLLQQYHEEWKEIGPVMDDKKEEIWERFKTASDTINLRRKEHYEEIQGELQNNYSAKLVLCEKAEEITLKDCNSINEWNNASEEVTELLKVWKTLGPAPKKLNDEIWERFKSKLDLFFANKKAFLQKIKDHQLNSYNLKINLCLEAESIATRTDWKKATEELLKLQKEWKEIGSVPKKYSDQIWKRFRIACDAFFAAKSTHFSSQHEHEDDNLKAKEDLLLKIQAFEMGNDRNENLNTLKEFQRQWMEIGHVPTQEKDRLYLSFKNLVNKHWEILKASSSDNRANNYKSYVNELIDSPDGNQAIEKERRFLQNKVTKLREDAALWENNLGFFANSKNAIVLKQEFEKKIELAKLEIKSIEEKIKLLHK